MYLFNARLCGRTKTIQLLRIMQLTGILLTICCLTASAKVISQITLKETNAPLHRVFEKIREQSGYDIIFNGELIKSAGNVTVNINNVSPEEAVKVCLEGKNLDYAIVEKTVVIKEKIIVSARTLAPPPITVKGRVVDEEGKPVEGVTVTVKGSKTMTATNSNGEFTLFEVDNNASLVFTHASIERQDLKVNGRNDLTIGVKKKVSALDEVHYIAYGKSSQRFQTGNVASLKAKDIEKQPVNNPLLALQGRVPGLFVEQTNGLPGGGIKVRIQGENSITNGSDPLYVINGTPYPSEIPPGIALGPLGNSGGRQNNRVIGSGNALTYINPSDIESITILKDADATAIYGSRAANGAILITTKQGRTGKTSFEINFQKGIGVVNNKIDLLSTREYIQMRKEAFFNDSVANPVFYQPPNEFNAPDLLLWDTTDYTDWQSLLIGNTAHFTNLNAGLSGGNATLKYLLRGTYQRETSVMPGDFFDKRGRFILVSTVPTIVISLIISFQVVIQWIITHYHLLI